MTIWIPGKKTPLLHVVKPVYMDEMPSLDDAWIARNAARGCETVMVCDTNVLGQMHQFAMMGGRREYLAELGLDQLIAVLDRPNRRTMVLAAGAAFQELPPSMLHAFDRAFEWFVGVHLPGYGDHPLALPPRLSTPEAEHGFWDRSYDSQIAISLSYSLLLLLQVALLDDSKASPMARLECFVNLILAEADVLGAKELEAGRWCLSPPIDRDALYTSKRKRMIDNFARHRGKPPRSAKSLKHVALNGALDLWMVTSAAYMEARGLQGIAQDVWILTYDGKLAEYCRMFNYLPAGALTGALAACTHIPSDHDPGYWQQSAQWLDTLQQRRIMERRGRTYADEADRLQVVRRCEALLETQAESRFGSPQA